jgi:hypothetical protein
MPARNADFRPSLTTRVLWEVSSNGNCGVSKGRAGLAARPSDSPLGLGLQQSGQSVRWLKRSLAQMRRQHRLDGFELFCRIGANINLGGGQIGMTQPERDLANIMGGLKHNHCAGVSQYVR